MTERAFPQANLASERLTLRPFQPDDAVDVHAVWNDSRLVGHVALFATDDH